MYSSAIRSSSFVVTPGRIRSARRESASATTRPARAIVSSSSCDLRMITSLRRGRGLEDFLDLREDFVDRAVGVDADEVAARAVVLDELFGDALHLHPVMDHLRSVVFAPLLERPRVQSLLRQLLRKLKMENDGDVAVEVLEDAVERLGLVEGARKALDDEAGHRVVAAEPLAHHLANELVGDEIPARHDRLDFAAELAARGALGAEHVTRVDVRNPGLSR